MKQTVLVILMLSGIHTFLDYRVIANSASRSVGSCRISCSEDSGSLFFGNWDSGNVGPKGSKGDPGESCDCTAINRQLSDQIEEIKAEIKELKASMKVSDNTGYYQAKNGYWYKVLGGKVDYATAKRNCEKEGSRLASFGLRSADSRREILDNVIKPNSDDVWIGLNDLQKTNQWMWSDGVRSNVVNTDWKPGEPTGGEHCCHMWKSYSFQVNDAHCSRTCHPLCEKEP